MRLQFSVATAFLLGAAPAVAAAPESGEVAALRRMVIEQQAQIEALTKRLNAIDARTSGDKQAASAAPAAQATAVAAAPAAGAPAQVAPAPVQAVAAASPPNPAGDPFAISFRGAPELSTRDGWRFKLRGRLNYDAAYIENPGNAIPTTDLGGSTRIRRVRIGVEGDMPVGFGYKTELEFNDSRVGYADILLSWRGVTPTGRGPIEIGVGHIEPLNGFEQISSSRYTSLIERAEFNTAFGNFRRLGAYATYISPDVPVRISVGAFNDTINADRANTDLLLSSRAFWAPMVGDNQLHVGGSVQYRRYQKNDLAFQYRVQPFSANTSTRFVDTGSLAVRDDLVLGAEFLGIFGPFHVAGEVQHVQVHTLRPDESLNPGEATSGLRTNGDPGFLGGHVEAGWIITGESRGYKDGLWARTRVHNPVGTGGSGLWAINARYDWLDLTDQVGDPASVLPVDLINGGTQSGVMAALVWQPMDYVRFTLQYTHGWVTGGPFQKFVNPLGTEPLSERSFDFDVSALRAAWDF